MRPSQEIRDLLEREATLRAQLTSYARIAKQTGYSEQYIANYVGRLIRAKREQVDVSLKPRRFSRTKNELEAIACELICKTR
jgi:hypothetical protein